MKYTLPFFLLLFVFACSSGGENKKELVYTINATSSDTINTSESDTINEEFENVKKLFESLPATHDVITVLLDQPGTKYNSAALNPSKNSIRYTTMSSRAFNIGVYCSDMCYSALFEQNQTVINYMAVVVKLSEDSGLLRFFDDDDFKNIERNLSDKDAVISIISDAFYKSDSQLIQNGQPEYVSHIISGAWIEAMYIACYLSKGKVALNKKLTSNILDQAIGVKSITSFISKYSEDEYVKNVLESLKKIEKLTSEMKISKDENGLYYSSPNDFKLLCNTIFDIRKSYTEL